MEKKRREGGMEYGGEQTVLPWSNSSFLCLSLCHTIEVHCTGLERPFFALWCLSSMQCRPWVPFRQEFGHIVQVVHRCCLPFLWNTCWIQLLYAFGNTRAIQRVWNPTFLNIGLSHKDNFGQTLCTGLLWSLFVPTTEGHCWHVTWPSTVWSTVWQG